MRDQAAFARACAEAGTAAQNGWIVTFGIHPTFPATKYGYIAPGAPINGGAAVKIESFVEKPDTPTAIRYIAEHYLWNSGNFVFRADTMLGELRNCEPHIAEAAEAAVNGITNDLDFLRLPEAPFKSAPKKSIDYAVMERTKRAAVIPLDCGWSDVGSWSAVWDELDHNADGNASTGSAMFLDSHNSLVVSEDAILTTVVGGGEHRRSNNTRCCSGNKRRAESEQVKQLVERLKLRIASELPDT